VKLTVVDHMTATVAVAVQRLLSNVTIHTMQQKAHIKQNNFASVTLDTIQGESVNFIWKFFPEWLRIFNQNFTHLLPGCGQKTYRTFRNYNGAYTLWRKISFCTFVDQYVLVLTYKFQ